MYVNGKDHCSYKIYSSMKSEEIHIYILKFSAKLLICINQNCCLPENNFLKKDIITDRHNHSHLRFQFNSVCINKHRFSV